MTCKTSALFFTIPAYFREKKKKIVAFAGRSGGKGRRRTAYHVGGADEIGKQKAVELLNVHFEATLASTVWSVWWATIDCGVFQSLHKCFRNKEGEQERKREREVRYKERKREYAIYCVDFHCICCDLQIELASHVRLNCNIVADVLHLVDDWPK
jgi:hypothetical protein